MIIIEIGTGMIDTMAGIAIGATTAIDPGTGEIVIAAMGLVIGAS